MMILLLRKLLVRQRFPMDMVDMPERGVVWGITLILELHLCIYVQSMECILLFNEANTHIWNYPICLHPSQNIYFDYSRR